MTYAICLLTGVLAGYLLRTQIETELLKVHAKVDAIIAEVRKKL
jgi:hypothetical protein